MEEDTQAQSSETIVISATHEQVKVILAAIVYYQIWLERHPEQAQTLLEHMPILKDCESKLLQQLKTTHTHQEADDHI